MEVKCTANDSTTVTMHVTLVFEFCYYYGNSLDQRLLFGAYLSKCRVYPLHLMCRYIFHGLLGIKKQTLTHFFIFF